MALACASRSRGIALSGIFIIASNALAAFADCAAASLRFAACSSSERAWGVIEGNAATAANTTVRTKIRFQFSRFTIALRALFAYEGGRFFDSTTNFILTLAPQLAFTFDSIPF